jgi:hypothetical protein
MGTLGGVQPAERPAHGRPYSLELTLPAGSFFSQGRIADAFFWRLVFSTDCRLLSRTETIFLRPDPSYTVVLRTGSVDHRLPDLL